MKKTKSSDEVMVGDYLTEYVKLTKEDIRIRHNVLAIDLHSRNKQLAALEQELKDKEAQLQTLIEAAKTEERNAAVYEELYGEEMKASIKFQNKAVDLEISLKSAHEIVKLAFHECRLLKVVTDKSPLEPADKIIFASAASDHIGNQLNFVLNNVELTLEKLKNETEK